MSKNQFFIVGAQRSATTYLYTILDEHPEICMAKPVKPEPKYFLNNTFDEDEYYSRYYKDFSYKIKIYGEKSTSYYEKESVAQKIAVNIPYAKIIFILANPVDRALSNYKFSLENGLETRSLKNVFLNIIPIDSSDYSTSVNPFNYIERGIYYRFLEYYYSYFPKENIKIIVKEEFTNNINAIQNLYNFLECDNSFVPDSLDIIINKNNKKLEDQDEQLVKEKLSEYYEEYNYILYNKFNINIENWI